MKTIWKYPLKYQNEQTLKVPAGYVFLHAAEDPKNAEPVMWLEVDDDEMAPQTQLTILMYGTGHDAGAIKLQAHLATVVMRSGYVWHLYRRFA